MVSIVAAHSKRISAVLRDRGATARSALAASWSRSLVQHGLDPERPQLPPQLDFDEFRHTFAEGAPMVHSARETLDRLFSSVRDLGCCIVLSNRDGVILDRRVDSRDHTSSMTCGPAWCGAKPAPAPMAWAPR